MRISVPIVFEEYVLPKGMKKPRPMQFGEWVDVELNSVSSLDAPIAIQCKSPGRHYTEIDKIATLRHYDGKFWQPQAYSRAGTENKHVTSDQLIEMTREGTSYCNPLVWERDAFYFASTPQKYPKFDPTEFRRVDTNNRTESLEAIEKSAAQTLIIDGMVWTEAPEPILVAKPISSFHSRDVFEIEIVPEDFSGSQGSVFRLDRLDDAIAFGIQKWGEGGYRAQKPSILMPETLQFEDDTRAVPVTLTTFLSDTNHAQVLAMPKTSIMAWVDLREAIYAMNNDGCSESTIDQAIDRAKAFRQIENEDSWQYRDLDAAIYRWENKPIQIGFENAF